MTDGNTDRFAYEHTLNKCRGCGDCWVESDADKSILLCVNCALPCDECTFCTVECITCNRQCPKHPVLYIDDEGKPVYQCSVCVFDDNVPSFSPKDGETFDECMEMLKHKIEEWLSKQEEPLTKCACRE